MLKLKYDNTVFEPDGPLCSCESCQRVREDNVAYIKRMIDAEVIAELYRQAKIEPPL